MNRALDILEALRDSPQPLSLGELAALTEIDKATTMRIARDLVERGYLEQSPETRRYSLGLGILELADRLWAKDAMTQNTLRYLEDLRDKTLQTVALCTRSGDSYVVSLELTSLQPIKFSQGVGTSLPLAGDAPGRAILAHSRLPSAGVDRKVLDKVRDDGYAYSVGSTTPFVASVAAAVVGAEGAESAVCLSWIVDAEETEPLARRRYSVQVMGCAQRISRLRQTQGRWR